MSSLKKQLVAEIVRSLEKDAELLVSAAVIAHEAATHEESKAEDKYDTRGLEASYLAGAQAKRAAELQQLIYFYKNLELPDFKNKPVGVTSLVELESKGRRSYFFIVPKGGGKQFEVGERKIQTITPVSRFGEGLLGKNEGDTFELDSPAGLCEYQITNVI